VLPAELLTGGASGTTHWPFRHWLVGAAQTLRACVDDSANQQEAKYMDALDSAGRYELTGGELTIFYNGGASALHYVKA